MLDSPMLDTNLVVLVVAVYAGLLSAIGLWGERTRAIAARPGWRAGFYGLSLATLCSAWTYFGALGDAAGGSWLFLANALGPILAITLGFPVWRRIAVLSKQENVGSLADFLAARYGKSRVLGVIVTIVAVLGALPYVALQLMILMQVLRMLGGTATTASHQSLIIVLLLAAFAILFGARKPSLTQHNRGFVSIIAVESCVKLSGLVGVAVLCVSLFSRSGADVFKAIPPLAPALNSSFLTLTLLCTVTAFTLPRQFHLGFVTLEKPEDIRAAPWIVPAYFIAWSLATLVIAAGVRAGFGMPGVDPHLQVLALPSQHGHHALALIALLGGLSAGAAMVIVETTAVSAMVSNEIILPLLTHALQHRISERRVGGAILVVRRVTIVLIAVLAWGYYRAIHALETPTQLGQTALTAFAQLLPALFGGIYWRRGHANGAIAGLLAGMTVWALTIDGAALIPPALVGHDGPRAAPWWLLQTLSEQQAILLSLALNAGLYVAVSLRSTPRLIDRIQADSFVSQPRQPQARPGEGMKAKFADLQRLLAQFIGEHDARKALLELRLGAGERALDDQSEATPNHVRAAERLLAGVIGASSARNVIAIALAAESQDAADISRILDEAGHAVHFSRELLQTTLDTLPQAVGVIDADDRLTAWNRRFLEMLRLSVELVHIGQPLADLLAAESEDSGARAMRDEIMALLDAGGKRDEQARELVLGDGRTLRFTAVPLGRQDYLLTLADISDLKQAERILTQSNEELEARVQARTIELTDVNHALNQAKQVAELATSAQKRFVATASHDLVQPLHAARLFIGNAIAAADGDAAQTALLEKADMAVDGAHKMLRALLSLSQLETGALRPRLEPVDAGALLASLAEEFAGEAEARRIALTVLPTSRWVRSDGDLLRSVLQNLMLNALRYTVSGRVVVAARFAGPGRVRFEVRDTGVGISPEKLPIAFGEFSRLAAGRSMADGAGLGLSIVARICQVLDHAVAVRSREGAGSVFAITVPASPPAAPKPAATLTRADLRGLRVLCVDDEHDLLVGTQALIERWGGVVTAVESAELVRDEAGPWDVAIADYHLSGDNGIELLRRLGPRAAVRLLLTATPDEIDPAELERCGVSLLRKPLAPLVLQSILVAAAGSGQAGAEPGRAAASS